MKKIKSNPKLTIFTPIYNREKYLQRLYDSLRNQTCMNFEWIAIDDGSTDQSFQTLQKFFVEQGAFPVRIFRQENGGKHRAINNAVSHARGEYLFIVDSDDWLLSSAVEQVLRWITKIEELDDFDQFAGVAGLRCTPQFKIIGGNGNGIEFIDATNIQRKKFNLLGDKAEIYKVNVLKKYPFIEFEGETFLSEEAVWNKIAMDGLKIRWYNTPIYVCEYLDNGLTANFKQNEISNFKGFTYVTKQKLLYENWHEKIYSIYHYMDVARLKKMSYKDIARKLDIPIIGLFFCYWVKSLHMYISKYKF